MFCHPALGTPLDPIEAHARCTCGRHSRRGEDHEAVPSLARPPAHGADARGRGRQPAGVRADAKAGHSQGSITERYIHAAQVAFPGAADRGEDRIFSAVGAVRYQVRYQVAGRPSSRRKGRICRTFSSSPGWTRTNNPPVNSRMLCQLSYRGTARRHCSAARARFRARRVRRRSRTRRELLLQLRVRSERPSRRSSPAEAAARAGGGGSSLAASLVDALAAARASSSAQQRRILAVRRRAPTRCARARAGALGSSKCSGDELREQRRRAPGERARRRARRARAGAPALEQRAATGAAAPGAAARGRSGLHLLRQVEPVGGEADARPGARASPRSAASTSRTRTNASCAVGRALDLEPDAVARGSVSAPREPLLEALRRRRPGRCRPAARRRRTSKPCAAASSIPRSVAASPAASPSKQRQRRARQPRRAPSAAAR